MVSVIVTMAEDGRSRDLGWVGGIVGEMNAILSFETLRVLEAVQDLIKSA